MGGGKAAEELLVFGYSCRLFRDDARAAAQDSATIPAPADPDARLDRFDCRLHLGEAEWAAASAAGAAADLDGEERVEEELCDEERYADLRSAEAKELEEEDAKRGRGAQVPFSYDGEPETSGSPAEGEETLVEQADEEEDKPYRPRAELKVPKGMAIPDTVKVNVMVEKTAAFVAAQGAQMEIVIKAKQGSNPQFSFMDYGDTLNHYYRHVLKMIRNKRYTPIPLQAKKKEPERNRNLVGDYDSSSDSDDSGHYLHPLLAGGDGESASQSPKPPPSGTHTPPVTPAFRLGEGNDIYSALFRNLSALIPKKPGANGTTEEKTPTEDEADVVQGKTYAAGQGPLAKELPKEEKVDEEEKEAEATPAQMTEIYAKAPPSDYLTWHFWFYGRYAPFPSEPQATPPPPDLQPVVQKTAEFVFKFGPQAEAHLRSRSELQLEFLEPGHPFNPFYQIRIRWLQYEEFTKCLQEKRMPSLPNAASVQEKQEQAKLDAEKARLDAEKAALEPPEEPAPEQTTESTKPLNRKERRRRQFHSQPTQPDDARLASEDGTREGEEREDGEQNSESDDSSRSGDDVMVGPLLPPSQSAPVLEEPPIGPLLPPPKLQTPPLPPPPADPAPPPEPGPSETPPPPPRKRRPGFAKIGERPLYGNTVDPPGLVVVPKPGVVIPHPLARRLEPSASAPALVALDGNGHAPIAELEEEATATADPDRQSERRRKALAFLSRLKGTAAPASAPPKAPEPREEGEVADSSHSSGSSDGERRRRKKKKLPSTYARTRRSPDGARFDRSRSSRERRKRKRSRSRS